MRTLFTTIAFFLAALSLSAQTAVHFDRPFHVAGEVTWFAAYPPQPAPKKVKATVFAPDGTAIDYFFLKGDANGQLKGYYRWPFEVSTGYYRIKLQAFTTDRRVIDLGTYRHAVYSDQRIEAVATASAGKGNQLPAANGLTLQASPDGLQIGGLNGAAYSVSVFNTDVSGQTGEAFLQSTETPRGPWLDTLFYNANVSLQDGSPVVTNLLPVFDPGRYVFGFAKTGPQGNFTLQLGAFEGEKDLQVRALDPADLKPTVDLPKLAAIGQQPPLTKEVAAYVDLSRRRRKIYQLFATVETEIEAKITAEERRKLFPNRDFDVQDYKSFPDMYTFFKEVGGELRVKAKKGNYSARLYNAPNQRFFLDSPLYIVDGKLTQNENYINTMSPAEVSYLAYYYVGSELRKYFPALGNNGVIQIETLREPTKFPEEDADDIFAVKGLQPEAAFQVRDAEASDVPALSPLLLWKTGKGESNASISLPATDDFGSYRVVVLARAADGSLRSVSKSFAVEVK